MAVDKLVDSTQLDAGLTSVANAIRTKGGTSGQLAFPAGFVSAVNAIPTGGGSTQIVTGTFVGDGTNTFTLPCSFAPDIIWIVAYDLDINTAGWAGIKSWYFFREEYGYINRHTNDTATINNSAITLCSADHPYGDDTTTSYSAYFTYANGSLVCDNRYYGAGTRVVNGATYTYRLIKL